MYYIKSEENPADLGTKFKNFSNTYLALTDESLFRRGPECLKMGIEAAVSANRLVPIDKISPTQIEKNMAALEVVKLHQLVITENRDENLKKELKAGDDSIDDALACLITTTDKTIEEESWMSQKTSGYRAQKATKTFRDTIGQVEEFSKYLMSP